MISRPRFRSRPCGIAILILLLGSALPALAQSSPPSTDLQAGLQRIMAGQQGAAVVVNVVSGKIVAQWHLEVAAQRREQPGSTLKPFVLMELLSTGKVNPRQRLMCRRPLFVAGRRMDCSHPVTVDTLDAPDAIAYSCNSYFAAVAARLENDELPNVLRQAGFASSSGLAANEVAGHISTPADPAQVQLQALGHWGIEVTPLELLSAYRKLALKKLDKQDLGSDAPVFDGLERAVRYGVAHNAQPHRASAAGKTGTASGVNTPQTHAFFVGYSPADQPEIALIVYLEHGRGVDAAAFAGKMFDAYWNTRKKD